MRHSRPRPCRHKRLPAALAAQHLSWRHCRPQQSGTSEPAPSPAPAKALPPSYFVNVGILPMARRRATPWPSCAKDLPVNVQAVNTSRGSRTRVGQAFNTLKAADRQRAGAGAGARRRDPTAGSGSPFWPFTPPIEPLIDTPCATPALCLCPLITAAAGMMGNSFSGMAPRPT